MDKKKHVAQGDRRNIGHSVFKTGRTDAADRPGCSMFELDWIGLD